MHIRRLGLAVGFAALTILSAVPSSAGTTAPQVSDPSGDATGGQASTDILSATYSTTGVTTVAKVRGKTVKTYKPKVLVATLTLAAPPSKTTGMKYELNAQVDGCGSFGYSYTPGAATGDSALFMSCPAGASATSGGTLIVPDTTFLGNSIVWSVPLNAMPAEVKLGSAFSSFAAATDLAEPITGVIGTDILGLDFDTATSDVVWKLH